MDAQREEVKKHIAKLSDDLSVRQESINLLKSRLTNLKSFKETIAKVLDIDTSLAEKIQTLFRERGIMIVSILKAIGMAIGVLVELCFLVVVVFNPYLTYWLEFLWVSKLESPWVGEQESWTGKHNNLLHLTPKLLQQLRHHNKLA